jgi:HD-GYP domain-containing protein (c-di-GMP phosphodiesterase class II)
MVMASQNQLLLLTNYRELAGYKANVVFDVSYPSTFGFNKDSAVLCSIVDKALRLIDTKGIAGHWTHRTYDYRVKVAQSRLPWLIGALAAALSVMILLFVLYRRTLRENQRINQFQNVVIGTMTELVEYRDGATGGHVERTSRYLKVMLDELRGRRLFKEQTASWNTDRMIQSAQLHNVGKIAVNDSILRKPGKLTENEFEEMKKHTLLGGKIIENIQEKTNENEFLNYAKLFAIYHHEKWDGTGYPHGLKDEDIPLPARLMAIIDVYDALISERPYKKAFSHEEAIRIIQEGRGTTFDPVLTDLFLSVADSLLPT